jgi:hypothetical protein
MLPSIFSREQPLGSVATKIVERRILRRATPATLTEVAGWPTLAWACVVTRLAGIWDRLPCAAHRF